MNTNSNKKVDETLCSLDDAKRVSAPKTLKKKILDKTPFVRQETRIVPMSYYYRASVAAAVLVLVNVFAISHNIENKAQKDAQHSLVREYYGSVIDNF